MTENLASIFLRKKEARRVKKLNDQAGKKTPREGVTLTKVITDRREADRVRKLNEESEKIRQSGTTTEATPSPEKGLGVKRKIRDAAGVQRKRLTASLFVRKTKLGA